MPRRAVEVSFGTAGGLEAVLPVGVSRGASLESGSRGWSVARSSRSKPTSRERRPKGEPCVPVPSSPRGGQTLPTREPSSCVAQAKGLACSWKPKRFQASSKSTILVMHEETQVEQQKGSVIIPNNAKCEVTLGVISVSFRRYAYDARSRCHSLVCLR